jgi:hypothetical protein
MNVASSPRSRLFSVNESTLASNPRRDPLRRVRRACIRSIKDIDQERGVAPSFPSVLRERIEAPVESAGAFVYGGLIGGETRTYRLTPKDFSTASMTVVFRLSWQ